MKLASFLSFSACRFSTREKTPFQETKGGAEGKKRRDHHLLAPRVTTTCVPHLLMSSYSTNLFFQAFCHLCGQDRLHFSQAGVTNGIAGSLRSFLGGLLCRGSPCMVLWIRDSRCIHATQLPPLPVHSLCSVFLSYFSSLTSSRHGQFTSWCLKFRKQ